MDQILTPQRSFTPEPTKPKFFKRHKVLIIIVSIVIVLIGTSIWIWVASSKNSDQTAQTPIPTATQAPTTESVINGVLVGADYAKKRPVAVMIENSPDARPQVGLVSADLVYEAVTEGGITRFMALYAQNPPKKNGPVRSARSYFIDYLSEFDAVYVHAGGSPTALARIGEYKIKAFPHNTTSVFWREPKAGVASEHTLFANISAILEQAVTVKKWSPNIDIQSWQFKDPTLNGPKSTVNINFTTPSYQVVWNYDPTNGEYGRSLAGQPHLDRDTKKQISATTIITLIIQRSSNPPYKGTGKESEWTMQTIGSGNAGVYQGGTQTKGTWKKPSRTERTRFYDEAGTEIKIDRGKIWVEIVPQTGSVTYSAT